MKKIFETIRKYGMIEEGMTVVAGVSGGADSVCLLVVLNEYRKVIPFSLRVVHVEHGIRGEASRQDAVFTENLCEDMGIPCHVVHVNVCQKAEESGCSLEEAGRTVRYELFAEELERAGGFGRIAVAHNRNDQAETVLWNLARGSGLHGLCGMSPVRDDIIRPLLFTDRARIEELLRERGMEWRTDATNLTTDYTRNKIRLSLLPQMQEDLNQKAVEHIADAAGRLSQVADYLDSQVRQAMTRCVKDGDELILAEFCLEDKLIRTELIRRLIEQAAGGIGLKNIGQVHLDAILDLTFPDEDGQWAGNSTLDLPGRLQAVRNYDRLRILMKNADRKDETVYPLKIPGSVTGEGWEIETALFPRESVPMAEIITEKTYTKCLSYDTIKSTVCMRHRKPGDYLVVNEQGNHRKLKDYLIDVKVPREERDRLWLLADGSRILWIPGYRISADAKVTEQTGQVIKVQYKESDKNEVHTQGGQR